MTTAQVIAHLKRYRQPKTVQGMMAFGIKAKKPWGVKIPILRQLARQIGQDHGLALSLWRTEIHEARILAGMIAEPHKITSQQMDSWTQDFDSWDVCDQVCLNLYRRTPRAFQKVKKWSKDRREYVRRAGFALIACLAIGDKFSPNTKFIQFFPIIKKYSTDERNFVRKAVNWALRQVGKRNKKLNVLAIKSARDISRSHSKSARWIAADALRELQSKAVQKRLK
ncbi:MAG: DNA alkylation repair protein [Parcubacteria group bacterium]|nr:MAG: DNA alkylation repair protein [Parcubacteria group bacterium]